MSTTSSPSPPPPSTPPSVADVPAASVPRDRPPMGARMPSLNQLAARINNANGSSSAPSTTRPRLASSLLRTASQASIATHTSAGDSTAVNPPSSRSASPGLTASSAGSGAPSEVGVGAEDTEPLTAEKLEKHNHTLEATAPNGSTATEKRSRGYKNIPSLDAITARLAMARTLSLDGSAQPPEPETYEDPKTPGIPIKAPEHPLQHPWTIYHDTKAKMPFTPAPPTTTGDGAVPFTPHPSADTGTYEAGLTVVGEFDTVESFCRYFNWLKPPSNLERNSNYHLFKSGIKPMWEDAANAQGGKWVLTMKSNPELLDRCWSWLAMALVGEELDDDDELCGAVVSLRAKVDRIQLWTRSKDDVEKINGIGRKLVKVLNVSEADGIGLEFQFNTDDRPTPSKFLSIQAVPQSSYRSTFQPGHAHSNSLSTGVASPISGTGEGPPPLSAPGGAFGNFNLGGGGGFAGGWRGKQVLK